MTTILLILAIIWFVFLAINMAYMAYMTIRDDIRKEKAKKESEK